MLEVDVLNAWLKHVACYHLLGDCTEGMISKYLGARYQPRLCNLDIVELGGLAIVNTHIGI